MPLFVLQHKHHRLAYDGANLKFNFAKPFVKGIFDKCGELVARSISWTLEWKGRSRPGWDTTEICTFPFRTIARYSLNLTVYNGFTGNFNQFITIEDLASTLWTGDTRITNYFQNTFGQKASFKDCHWSRQAQQLCTDHSASYEGRWDRETFTLRDCIYSPQVKMSFSIFEANGIQQSETAMNIRAVGGFYLPVVNNNLPHDMLEQQLNTIWLQLTDGTPKEFSLGEYNAIA